MTLNISALPTDLLCYSLLVGCVCMCVCTRWILFFSLRLLHGVPLSTWFPLTFSTKETAQLEHLMSITPTLFYDINICFFFFFRLHYQTNLKVMFLHLCVLSPCLVSYWWSVVFAEWRRAAFYRCYWDRVSWSQSGFRLTIYPRLAFTFWFSYLRLLRSVIISGSYDSWPLQFFFNKLCLFV